MISTIFVFLMYRNALIKGIFIELMREVWVINYIIR